LKVQVWDKDIIDDDLIGETEVDLEERFYDERYRSMEDQPIEQRKLTLFSSGQEVGYINLWIDMNQVGNRRLRNKRRLNNDPVIWDISSMPA
jgi:hypothetical protein